VTPHRRLLLVTVACWLLGTLLGSAAVTLEVGL
jgi:hypothetical protein